LCGTLKSLQKIARLGGELCYTLGLIGAVSIIVLDVYWLVTSSASTIAMGIYRWRLCTLWWLCCWLLLFGFIPWKVQLGTPFIVIILIFKTPLIEWNWMQRNGKTITSENIDKLIDFYLPNFEVNCIAYIFVKNKQK
jgi:hypothetical protein